MKYQSKIRIKTLIVAGVLTFNMQGCGKEIYGYSNNLPQNVRNQEQESNIENANSKEQESYEEIESNLIENKEIAEFREKLETYFETNNLILDGTMDEFVSSIVIDGTNVSIELSDGSDVSGTLYNLEISDITLENLYIYDSKYTDDLFAENNDKKYTDYKEKGYDSSYDALRDEFSNHKKLDLKFENCSVYNEYKKGDTKDIKCSAPNNKIENLDYSACKKLWLYDCYLEEDEFSKMPNLETLILLEPETIFLQEEKISIESNSLKNIIIDGQINVSYIDKFDFTMCPNLEKLSIMANSQETNLEGLKGLNNLKQLSFGIPASKYYDIDGLIYKDFQERIDMICKPFPVDHEAITIEPNCIIQDISAINGSNIEVLNISFLHCINSNELLETVKSLPNLKEIVGFEINNAGMCSDELLMYCEKNEIKHPFTEKSLEIKHKLEEIVSNVITEDMTEEEKVKALSEYVVSHMEYDDDVIDDDSKEAIIKGWGECLYYSVIEEKGVCNGYTKYAQNLFNEAGIKSIKTDGIGHTWNLVQIEGEYYFVDLTNIDVLVNEQASVSFDNYSLYPFYLLPIDKAAVEFPYFVQMLPIDAEKIYEEAWDKSREEENIDTNEEELKGYIIQVDRKNLREYSSFCGIVGILCALGLAKKVTNKEISIKKNEDLEYKEEVIKVDSLKDVIDILKRDNKLEQLRNKRKEVEEERNINNKARELEVEASKIEKGTNIR